MAQYGNLKFYETVRHSDNSLSARTHHRAPHQVDQNFLTQKIVAVLKIK